MVWFAAVSIKSEDLESFLSIWIKIHPTQIRRKLYSISNCYIHCALVTLHNFKSFIRFCDMSSRHGFTVKLMKPRHEEPSHA